jgi:hypothetical protein
LIEEILRRCNFWPPELIQGPGVLPNRGYKSIYKRYTKIGL